MVMEENGMNEKDVIVEAIEAIKGMSEQPEIALAMFVQILEVGRTARSCRTSAVGRTR